MISIIVTHLLTYTYLLSLAHETEAETEKGVISIEAAKIRRHNTKGLYKSDGRQLEARIWQVDRKSIAMALWGVSHINTQLTFSGLYK